MLFNEPKLLKLSQIGVSRSRPKCFSALQRAEIAEIVERRRAAAAGGKVSVLFNEPKLLKLPTNPRGDQRTPSFSALQRAEIAEIAMRSCASTPD